MVQAATAERGSRVRPRPPVRSHCDRPEPFQLTFERVKTITGKIKRLRRISLVETGKNILSGAHKIGPAAVYGLGEPGLMGSGLAGKSESGKPRTNLNVRSHLVRVKKCSPRSTKCVSREPADSPVKSSVDALYDQ